MTWEARRSELSVVGRVLAAQKVTEGEMEEVSVLKACVYELVGHCSQPALLLSFAAFKH